MIRVESFTDSATFAASATPMLLRREAENCFFLGLLSGATNPSKAMLLLVRDDDEPVGVATMTPGRHMLMSAMPPAGVDALVDRLAEQERALPGIQGAADDADRFAERWCA